MIEPKLKELVIEIEAIHRRLARMSVDQLLGTPTALTTADILSDHPLPLRPKTTAFLTTALPTAADPDARERIERIFYSCVDLAITEKTASLETMLKFYMERGRMIVGAAKIPALEVVPWLQVETDFDKRETMRSEMTIFLKGIVNPMLLAMLELTVKAVKEGFGFDNFARFSEARKKEDFGQKAGLFRRFLDQTAQAYVSRIKPWVEEKIGRPFENLSRYHALHLLRIRRFDEFCPVHRLTEIVLPTFAALGFDVAGRKDVHLDVSTYAAKNPDGICIAVEIPGEIHVLMKPFGGLIDVETLLHETGHAFFLAHVDPALPVEYRRLHRSRALDETFAFLFMDLMDNTCWLKEIIGLPEDKAGELTQLLRTKRLCLIRRYMGKFLAELEFHERGNIKDASHYCRNLHNATGFVYEPEGYLIDMEPDFYALDYLTAWAGSHVLRGYLERDYGEDWFRNKQAGDFLREVAGAGRRESVETVVRSCCGEELRFPDFA